MEEIIAGSIGGAVGCLVGHPLDVCKVRMQAEASKVTLRFVIREMIKNEGYGSLFKGASLPVLSQGLYTSASFFGYHSTLKIMNTSASNASLSQLFIAGSFGGIISTFVTTPCEFIKIHLQMDKSRIQLGNIRKIILQYTKPYGLKGLYTGLFPTMIRDSYSTGIYFSSYYSIIRKMDSNSSSSQMLSGGIAGVFTWLGIIPFDFIKTRIQYDASYRKGILYTIKKIMKEEGISSFFKGSSPILLRAFPVNAITFLVYEEVIKYLHLKN